MDGSGLLKPGSGSAKKPGPIRIRIRLRNTALTILVPRKDWKKLNVNVSATNVSISLKRYKWENKIKRGEGEYTVYRTFYL